MSFYSFSLYGVVFKGIVPHLGKGIKHYNKNFSSLKKFSHLCLAFIISYVANSIQFIRIPTLKLDSI
jgi:hypothetical protein